MGKYQGVIFDFDGTVVDSMPELTALAVEILVNEYDLTEADAYQKYISTTGAPFRTQLDLLFPGHASNDYAAWCFEDSKPAAYYGVQMVEGVSELIFDIAPFVKVGLVSSTSRKLGETVLSGLGLTHLFDDVWFNLTTSVDNKAASLTAVVSNWDVTPREVLFVGDSARDELYANKAGVGFVRLARGFATPDEIERIVLGA